MEFSVEKGFPVGAAFVGKGGTSDEGEVVERGFFGEGGFSSEGEFSLWRSSR